MAETLNNMVKHKLEQGGVEIKNVKVSSGLLTITAVLQPTGPPRSSF